MGEPGVPAVDPSYAWNSTGASGPTIASNTWANAIFIPLTDPVAPRRSRRIWSPYYPAACRHRPFVGRAVVPAAELFFGEEGRGVQRLVPAKRADFLLHHPVVVAVALARRQRGRAPEAEVDVQLARAHRVKGPRLVAAQADGAHPDRGHPHLLGEEG